MTKLEMVALGIIPIGLGLAGHSLAGFLGMITGQFIGLAYLRWVLWRRFKV